MNSVHRFIGEDPPPQGLFAGTAGHGVGLLPVIDLSGVLKRGGGQGGAPLGLPLPLGERGVTLITTVVKTRMREKWVCIGIGITG